MKKILVTAMCAAAFGLAAQAAGTDVLMWYLNLEDSPDAGTASSTTFDSINFYMVKSDDMSRTPVVSLNERTYHGIDNLQDQNAGIPSSSIQYGAYAGDFYTDLSGIDNLSQYEFMMTLYNGGDLVAWTAWLYNDNLAVNDPLRASLAQVNASLYTTQGGEDLNPVALGNMTPYNFGKNVVPEPTGGLLMLVGASLLALRRRRVISG